MYGQMRVGSCSICGGNVVLDSRNLDGTLPPRRCTSCGATDTQTLPVIPMTPNDGWRRIDGPTCVDSQWNARQSELAVLPNYCGGYGGMLTG